MRHTGIEEVRAAWHPICADEAATFAVEDTLACGERVVHLWR